MDYRDFFLDRDDGKKDIFTLPEETLDLSKELFDEKNKISNLVYS